MATSEAAARKRRERLNHGITLTLTSDWLEFGKMVKSHLNMTEAIINPPYLPNLDMKRPPTWPPVTGQNKVTITQVTLCSDWLIRGVTLSSDWLKH